jgi:hypothetical protein
MDLSNAGCVVSSSKGNIEKLKHNMLSAYITPNFLRFFLVCKAFGMLL